MRFLKFVTKTVVVAIVCSFIFSAVLEKTLSSQAKEDIKNGSDKIVNLISSKDKEDATNIKDESTIIEESTNKNEEPTKESTKEVCVPENILTNKNDNFIFIGDSRTVAYKGIVDIDKYDFITFISEVSKGYDWLKDTAIEKLNTRFDTTDLSYNVVLNLGVNDLQNVDKYIDMYNELAEKNPKHNFFVVSVNKVDTVKMNKNGYATIENSQIEEFNSKMRNSLSNKIHFIDSYSYFKDKNLETNDGVHYTDEVSSEILDYICDYIKAL